jgi:hypothetical protein
MVETVNKGAAALALSGGNVMTAIYGALAAMPVIWGFAGYVLVSHPGTGEPGVAQVRQTITAPQRT